MISAPLIYVIRHGQTDWNVEGRFQGSRDIPINATGRRQADENGLALMEILGDEASAFDYVASPLGRARETMERIRAVMALPADVYRTDERLIEVSYGDWEGYTLPELQAHEDAAEMRASERADSKWDFQPPGDSAESYEILTWRVAAWLESVKQPTVCVSHGGVVRALFHLIADIGGAEAAELETPQDRILKIEGGTIDWMPGIRADA